MSDSKSEQNIISHRLTMLGKILRMFFKTIILAQRINGVYFLIFEVQIYDSLLRIATTGTEITIQWLLNHHLLSRITFSTRKKLSDS